MKGTVEKVTKSSSGKAWRVLINSKWYGAKFDSKLDEAQGKAIDFDFDSDPKFGDWIKSWMYDHVASVASTVTASKPANGGDHSGLTEAEIRFISNVVGQAIVAKTITDPLVISQWAKAARQVLKEL